MEKLIIKDEIHGDIVLEGVYKELVEADDFQRLKDIIQAGTAYYQYADMQNETRFDHSIGSYYLMCRIIEKAEEKLAKQEITIGEEEKDIAKIAMLLHDIGHGAYSHTLESITGYSHEKRGIEIVKDENTQINQVLTKYYGKEFATKVGEFLESVYEHNETSEQYVDVKKQKVDRKLFASLISNNIDADRLDYLVRDSKKAGYKVLTDVDELIKSFEFILDSDRIIVAIPEEKRLLLDMALLERARNYRDIYFCVPSVIADNALNFLLEELRKNPQEVPSYLDPVIRKFFTNSKVNLSNKEYMKITETPIKNALQEISKNTKNRTIKQLCDIETIIKSYKRIITDQDEKYIRYLLHKAIHEIPEDTKGIVDDTRIIKPYKSNDSESINVITLNGIEDYKDIKQDLIRLEPFEKRTVAISYEMIRLELGVSKEVFDKEYKKTIDEVIRAVTNSKDEFELRYVMPNEKPGGKSITNRLKEVFEFVDKAQYMSSDVYYDDIETFELLKNRETLRIRKGTTYHNFEKTYGFKGKRATLKKYKTDSKSNFTIRRKEEKIGDTDNILEYKDFITKLGKNYEKLKPILDVNNLRYSFTLNINGALIDISFNSANYYNRIFQNKGEVGTIEIRPRENSIANRLALIQLKYYLETDFPYLVECLSDYNVYEIGMIDTYQKFELEDRKHTNALSRICKNIESLRKNRYSDMEIDEEIR